MLDHYNRPAIETHLREAGDKLLAAAESRQHLRDLLRQPRGLRRRLDGGPARASSASAAATTCGRCCRSGSSTPATARWTLRRDFGRTLTELFEERFLVPMREWATKNNVLLPDPELRRAAGHDRQLPPRGPDRRRGLAVPRRCTSSRWASSASHLFGKPVTSSETWTWLHSPAFRATPLDVKAEADQHFLAGHQPADRPRLAVLAAAGGHAGLAVLRRRASSPTRTRGGR